MFIFLQLPFPLFLLCHAIVCAGRLGQEGTGWADSCLLQEERGMDCELGFLCPTKPWDHGPRISFQPMRGPERQSLPPRLERSPEA